MKKYACIVILFVASVFTFEAMAQCAGSFDVDNSTADTWTISIHNVDITIPPMSSNTYTYTGGNPSASVGALYSTSPLCGSKFLLNAGFVPTPCAPNTTGVFYIKNTIDLLGCVTDMDVAIF